mmetsp:Transcript_105610/g.251769  ORF Transcript_105610/g.251769 Transcript_105610/m.251769 type:complete len:271 (+) Transcript_105610:265-1077(+)
MSKEYLPPSLAAMRSSSSSPRFFSRCSFGGDPSEEGGECESGACACPVSSSGTSKASSCSTFPNSSARRPGTQPGERITRAAGSGVETSSWSSPGGLFSMSLSCTVDPVLLSVSFSRSLLPSLIGVRRSLCSLCSAGLALGSPQGVEIGVCRRVVGRGVGVASIEELAEDSGVRNSSSTKQASSAGRFRWRVYPVGVAVPREPKPRKLSPDVRPPIPPKSATLRPNSRTVVLAASGLAAFLEDVDIASSGTSFSCSVRAVPAPIGRSTPC